MNTRTGLILACGLLAMNAQATVIDFGSLPVGPAGTSLISDGYAIAANGGFGTTLFVAENSDYGSAEKFLTWCISICTLSIEAADQGLFNLHSFDFSTSEIFGAAEVQITGFLGGGGIVTATLAVNDQAFTGYSFGSQWSGLERVEFDRSQAISGVIDNINVTAVPIPAAVWLFASSLAGLGWMRRRYSGSLM